MVRIDLKKMITPPKLKKRDLVGVCSPSGTIAHKRKLFEEAKNNFEAATGLKLVIAPHTLARRYYSAGTSEERFSDFDALLRDENIKAIIFAAGGDTAIDLVGRLDYDFIKEHPKIISGISDATTLLSAITAKTGLITFLGLEFLDFAHHDMTYEIDSIERAWFMGQLGNIHENSRWHDFDKTPTAYCGWQTIREGKAEGQLIGGNFQSFMQLVGTEYDLSFPQSILFLETYKLPKKQIHKGLMQLKLHGVLDRIEGLIIGYCLECDNPDVVGNEQPIAETVLEVIQDYDFPIMQVGEIGHRVENCLQPLGAQAHMDASKLEFEILEDVTVDV